jgi:hypothetical protein
MKYCRSCLTPDTRPNGSFNSQGICLPCEFAARGIEENYEKRLEDLKQIVHKLTRTTKKSRWQCIIGVSGGKDSTRQALWAREKLGVNPLLVSIAYPPKQISYVGAHNLSNLIDHGFDTMVIGPAPPEEANLARIPHMAAAFHCAAGLSDHTLGIAVPVAAVALGATIIEKHFCRSRSEPGPDSAFSLEPDEFKQMVEAIRNAEKAIGTVTYERTEKEKSGLAFRRSLFFARDLPAGHRLAAEDIRIVRPGHGLAPEFLGALLGKTLAFPVAYGTPVTWGNF